MDNLCKRHAKGRIGVRKYFCHNWTRAKRHSPRKSNVIGTSEFLMITSEFCFISNPSSGSLKSSSICLISESPPFRRDLLDRGEFIRPPAKFWHPFASRIHENRRSNPIYTQRPLGGLLGFWPSGPKSCGGPSYSVSFLFLREKQKMFHIHRFFYTNISHWY